VETSVAPVVAPGTKLPVSLERRRAYQRAGPKRQRAVAVAVGQPVQAYSHADAAIFVEVKVIFYPTVSPPMTFLRFPVLAP
jgi:hypothetical protein